MNRVGIIFLFISIGSAHPSDISPRIVNGTNANKDAIPFIVSLRNRGKHSCGGSIIDKQWILTAAHCVRSTNASSITIQYGVNVISFSGPTIVKLTKPIEYSDCVKPVHLPQQGYEVSNGTAVMLSGWGYKESGGSVQNKLRKVELITFSNNECKRRHTGIIRTSNICAGVPEGGKGQCRGDSGGPLVLGNVQLGIVSWSVKPCAVYPYPGVFTKVSYYVDWINKQVYNH